LNDSSSFSVISSVSDLMMSFLFSLAVHLSGLWLEACRTQRAKLHERDAWLRQGFRLPADVSPLGVGQ